MNAPIDSIGPRLKGRRAIVAGAGSGIGRAIAGRLIDQGARVVIADIDLLATQAASDEFGKHATCTQVDMAVGESVRRLMEEAVRLWGGLDVMVNNAGIGLKGTVESTEEVDRDRIMDVTLKGTFFGLKHALPLLRKSRGIAINICSIAALAAFLASDEAGSIVGAAMVIDGGMTAQ
jgi:NAD(P)-dependent dehydrogenase (short-subunit alcohol dehydrogenase family)